MGQATFVKVTDAAWRFDPGVVFEALKGHFAGWQLEQYGPRHLEAPGYRDGWEVRLSEALDTFIVRAAPAPMMELVAWVRAYVPGDVDLVVFDDQLTFDVRPLPVGVTAEQLRSNYWPDSWKVEQLSANEPPTREEWMRSGPPSHVVELMNLERPPKTGPDPE